MATYTSFLNLEKPTTSETFNLLKMNQNWDKIDQGVSSLNSKFVNVDTVAISEITSTHTINENSSSANRFGKVVHLRLTIKTTSAVSAFGTILTLPASLRPLTQFVGYMMGSDYAPLAFDITYAGALRIWTSMDSAADISLDITYFAQ